MVVQCGILVQPYNMCAQEEAPNYTKQKFVEIEESSQEALARFKTDIANSEIYDKLQKDLSTDPNDNYKILLKVLKKAKNIHLPKNIRNLIIENTEKKVG